MIDALATADDASLFIHAINRHPDQELVLTIHLPGDLPLPAEATHHWWQARMEPRPAPIADPDQALHHSDMVIDRTQIPLRLPPRSVNVLRLALR